MKPRIPITLRQLSTYAVYWFDARERNMLSLGRWYQCWAFRAGSPERSAHNLQDLRDTIDLARYRQIEFTRRNHCKIPKRRLRLVRSVRAAQ